MNCSDIATVQKAIENNKQSVKKTKEAWHQASRKDASESSSEFSILLGSGYRRIRKRPKGNPSPQLYVNTTEKQQELVQPGKRVLSTFIMYTTATS